MKYVCFRDVNGRKNYEAVNAQFANELRAMIGIVKFDKILNRELKAKKWLIA